MGTGAPLLLRADCSRCTALCCVALPFTRSADFAVDKRAGEPCRHLVGTACGIHDRLAESGFPGCVAFDCFGAGQRVAEQFGHVRDDAAFTAFAATRRLHELLWYLDEVRDESVDAAGLFDRIDSLARGDLRQLSAEDVGRLQAEVGALLSIVSAALRADDAPDHRHDDLAGRDLRRVRLRDADLRGATLIGADLRGVDLGRADLLGADLRGARVAGARLERVLFLTRPQLAAARSDVTTSVPGRVR